MKILPVALGVVLAASILGAAWALGTSDARSVKRSEMASVETKEDASMSASPGTAPNTARSRQVLGVWLLAVTGTAIGLRANKSRTI